MRAIALTMNQKSVPAPMMIATALGLVTVGNVGNAIVLVVILVAAGTLFWFMVKAMARIQMPERPSRAR